MHDIGKIAIPDQILCKPGRLTPEEYEQMKNHTRYGAEICRGSGARLLQMGEEIALGHHERWDGAGYPSGKRGEEIPLMARIVAVADVFDALISHRRYKPAWEIGHAVEHVQEVAGKHLDAELVRIFLEQRPEIERILAELPDAPEDSPSASTRPPHALR
jgi:putative two-component system response regulator